MISYYLAFATSTISFSRILAVPTFEPPQLRRFSYLGRMVHSQMNTTFSAGDISKRIVSYGCYCFRDGNSGSDASFGTGKPVDDQDRLCSNLMKCRRCIQMDFSGECDVHMEKYSYEIDSDNTILCDENQDPCKLHKCECDKAFAEDLAKVWNDDSFNEFYWGNSKNIRRRNKRNQDIFNGDESCKIVGEDNRLRADDCCGEVGRRLPYSLMRHDCCDNNRLAGIGQCL